MLPISGRLRCESYDSPVICCCRCWDERPMKATKRDNSQNRVDDQPSISPQMVREAEAIFRDHLRRVGLKHTGQRGALLRAFLDIRDHLAPDVLYRLVRKKDERIGFTTVYRTLKLLSE